MSTAVALYHWSPTSRRGQINRRGLVPGSRSVDGLWKPPYVCFADSPSLAWGLSGGMPGRSDEVPSWDLWMMWSDVPSGMEEIPFDEPGRVREYRVYERIFKRDLWYVATRTVEPGKGR